MSLITGTYMGGISPITPVTSNMHHECSQLTASILHAYEGK